MAVLGCLGPSREDDAGVVHGLGQLCAQLRPAAAGGHDLLVWDGAVHAVSSGRKVHGLRHLSSRSSLLLGQAGESRLAGFGDEVTGPRTRSRHVQVGLLTFELGVRQGPLDVPRQQEGVLGGGGASVPGFRRRSGSKGLGILVPGLGRLGTQDGSLALRPQLSQL